MPSTIAGVPASNRAGGGHKWCVKRHPVDHRAAALPRRHGIEHLGPPPQRADAGRAVELVRGKDIEIAVQRRHIDRQARHGLAAIEQQLCADGMRQLGGALRVEHRAEHIGDMGESDQHVVGREHRLRRIEIDPAIGGQRADIDLDAMRRAAIATARCCE